MRPAAAANSHEGVRHSTAESGVAPKFETGVKTHFSLNGELSHGFFARRADMQP